MHACISVVRPCILLVLKHFVLLLSVKRVVCNENFEQYLAKYLEKSGREFVAISEEYMDDAFGEATYNYSDAIVNCNSLNTFDRKEEYLHSPIEFPNNEKGEETFTYNKEVKYTTGLEYTKTECSQWSISGGLSAEYQSVGSTVGISYTKNQTEVVRNMQTNETTDSFTRKVSVPARHSREVVLTQWFQRKECSVKNVKLTFPKKAKVKCEFRDSHKRVKTRGFLIRKVLEDCIKETKANELTALIEGKYVWVETGIFVRIRDPVPINAFHQV